MQLPQSKSIQRVEWPTVLVAGLCYGMWILSTTILATWFLPLAILIAALSITLHSSLQHEVLHGHPFSSRFASVAMVFPALGLLVPYGRFRDLHLAHHRDEKLTDPYDDPETGYLDPKVWSRLPNWVQSLLNLNNTLAGRILIGPILSQAVFMRDDWRRIRAGSVQVRNDWVLHLFAVIPVVLWVVLAAIPLWAYLVAVYAGNAILRIRTYLEHRAHEKPRARSVVVEDRGLLSFLFLNNNFHAVHHSNPSIPWYKLPRHYFADRNKYLNRNEGYVFTCYGTVIRQFCFRQKEPVPHPLRIDDGRE